MSNSRELVPYVAPLRRAGSNADYRLSPATDDQLLGQLVNNLKVAGIGTGIVAALCTALTFDPAYALTLSLLFTAIIGALHISARGLHPAQEDPKAKGASFWAVVMYVAGFGVFFYNLLASFSAWEFSTRSLTLETSLMAAAPLLVTWVVCGMVQAHRAKHPRN